MNEKEQGTEGEEEKKYGGTNETSILVAYVWLGIRV